MALRSRKGWKSIVPLRLKGKSTPRFSLFSKLKAASCSGSGNGKTPVYLNVYDLTPMNGYIYWAGFGIFHSGVEVHGVEYAYGAHDYPSSGVFEVEPRQCPGFKFRRSILVGTTSKDSLQVREFMQIQAANYSGDSYHLIVKNCNHFCKDICYKLTGKNIPKWVNRLAKLGQNWIIGATEDPTHFLRSYFSELAKSGSTFHYILPESLKISVVQQPNNGYQQRENENEKKRLRSSSSSFSCLSSISSRQKQLSTSSLFMQSPLKGCLLPPWELIRSQSRRFKDR